ncbi:MAG TPA: fumarylacetoacetate hydrolase family protein, partial [Nitrospiraceae bacterium]|nr:fumarylacetoacetate hydrolase family protein [Nitrospiraceae bacterium]
MKPADALVESGATVPYPSRTANFHHEIELVVALGKGGRDIPAAQALECVFGYAVGNDFTRRDLQQNSRSAGLPWDTGKGFDHSAAISAIRQASQGHISSGRIWLSVNGRTRQQADVADMIWPVPEIIAELSTLFALTAGDLIYTGTPAGVGALRKADKVEGGIDGVGLLSNVIE